MGITDTLLGPVFDPLLNLGPFWAILIISLIVSFLVTIIYKLVTNQTEMKQLKTELKGYQNQMKQSKSEPEKVMSLQKQAMSTNMKYMKHSFKPTLITFIPILLVFGWLQAHLAFVPLAPGMDFDMTATFDTGIGEQVAIDVHDNFEIIGESNKTITSDTVFRLKAQQEGDYIVDVLHNGKIYSKDIKITIGQSYAEEIKTFKNEPIKSITINYNKLKPLGDTSLFGWQPGWLALYIIFSIIFSMSLRKMFKLY
jgi:uncharacterized membrane protein (DUF106 family)